MTNELYFPIYAHILRSSAIFFSLTAKSLQFTHHRMPGSPVSFPKYFQEVFRLLVSSWLSPALPFTSDHLIILFFSFLPQTLLVYFTTWPASTWSLKMTINSRLMLCWAGLSAVVKTEEQHEWHYRKGKTNNHYHVAPFSQIITMNRKVPYCPCPLSLFKN